MTATSPNELSLTEAARHIRDGELTSRRLVQSCLDRIEAVDGEIKAFVHLDAAQALAAADAADTARGTGNGVGPLHGVPVAIKDIIDTSDYPTEHGCPIFAGRQPTRDAACVAALRNAGAIIIGKTVTTELALLTPSLTRNPVNTNLTPGGSSAGSAAAVTAHMVPAALGSQTAGSVLRPASYTGTVGFKPTFGLVSRRGVLMQSHTLDTVGTFARSVDDTALLVDCLAGFDSDDPASFPRSQPNLAAIAAASPPTEPIFAFVKTPAWEQASQATHDAFAELADVLGARCEEVEIDSLADIIEWQRVTQIAENAAYYGPLLDAAPEHISQGLTDRIEAGRREPVVGYVDAIRARSGAIASVSRVFDRYGAILTPAAPGEAPEGNSSTGSPIFNGLWTYLGLPCVSLPLLTADYPIGVQLVGGARDDGRLLRAANWLTREVAQEAV